MSAEQKLLSLGLTLPPPPIEAGNYTSMKAFSEGKLVYVSGTGAEGVCDFVGRLGETLSLAQGYEAARGCMLNILSAFKAKYGSLDRIRSFVKLLVFVSGEREFYRQPEVANGASDLLVAVFGEEIGHPARSAVGVYALPDNIPVEIECIIEIN
ncbi:MAG: RidA family protein [Oscillospiraceae bacterium]